MSYLRHSFTLPNRSRKNKATGNGTQRASDDSGLRPLPASPGLSRSALNLCPSTKKNGVDYYALDKIEDIFKLKESTLQNGDHRTTTNRKSNYPDFYGGYPLPQYPDKPPPPPLIENTSDYESGNSENVSPSSENDSLCSSSTSSSSTGPTFRFKPWNTLPTRLRKVRTAKYYEYGVIQKANEQVSESPKKNFEFGSVFNDTTSNNNRTSDTYNLSGQSSSTFSNQSKTECDVSSTLDRSPTQYGVIVNPGRSSKSNSVPQRSDSPVTITTPGAARFSNIPSPLSSSETHPALPTYYGGPLSPLRSPSNVFYLGSGSNCASVSGSPFGSVPAFHCCCRNSCHTDNNPLYRINFHCCHQMEPLWETSPSEPNVLFRQKDTVNWYDRKLRPKSCPVPQDSELNELRSTIEALKKQSTEAGLAKMALQSMQAVQRTLQEQRMSRQLSTDSMSSVNSLSSACSGASGTSRKSGENGNGGSQKKKKKGWLRSSFSKAFSRSKKNKNGSVSDVEDLRQFQSDSSTPNSPLLGMSHHLNGGVPRQNIKVSHSSSALYEKDEENVPELVQELRKQLREKDMVLTDIRLEALTSAHQLEGLKDTVNKMRSEMMTLKHDNERLQKMVSSKSLGSSQSSLPLRNSMENIEKRLSASDHSGSPSIDMYLNDAATDREGKRVTISVFLGCHGEYNKYMTHPECLLEVFIGTVSVSGKTKWDLLDNVVKRAFKEYVLRVDPVSNLGLNAESVMSYHIGEIVRSKDAEIPELLPCGYLVGDNMQIRITLKGTKHNSVDALVFETLLPKSIIQRYVSLLTEHRRIILCGPSGTGKTYLAQKLAEFLVLRSGKELTAGSVATFSVDHKSAKELRQYLSNVAEQCESSNASDLPTVIILDNLHHVGALGEVFNGFLSAKYQKCPYIIGTMNQATCSTTNLQLHHNFRWVLCANHMEPVKGFLGRYLRRKLIEEEVRGRIRNPELTKIIDWMPKAWQHLNKFLETHSSSDVTIGPRLFLSCPVDVASSQVWFTDLWNYSIVPYLMEAVREGLQLYGRRAPWEDPADWVLETYPWPPQPEGEWPQLLRLRPEDVGYEGHPGPGLGTKTSHTAQNDVEADPLLNMLMRLQEAASYSSPHSNDSDSTSLDGHSGGSLHPEELITSGLESTL